MDLVLIAFSFPTLGAMYERPVRPLYFHPAFAFLDSGTRGLLRFFLGALSHNPIILSIIYCRLNIGPGGCFLLLLWELQNDDISILLTN